jgi:hypothetical protein
MQQREAAVQPIVHLAGMCNHAGLPSLWLMWLDSLNASCDVVMDICPQ